MHHCDVEVIPDESICANVDVIFLGIPLCAFRIQLLQCLSINLGISLHAKFRVIKLMEEGSLIVFSAVILFPNLLQSLPSSSLQLAACSLLLCYS